MFAVVSPWRPYRTWLIAAVGPALMLGSGCSGSVRVKSSAEVNTTEPDPFAALNDPEPASAVRSATPQPTNGSSAHLALLGARHDLDLKPHNEPSCSCMAFAVGKPSDARFAWEGARPNASGNNTNAVAFAMVEGECEPGLVASYRGYELLGSDVHILLEPAVDGRPQVGGALLPAPQPGGSYVVVPPKDAPFGRSRTPGEAQCRLAEGRVASAASTSGTGASTRSGTALFSRTQLHATTTDDVPSAEEFAETPSDIEDDSFESERSPRDGFHLGLMLGAEYPMVDIDIGAGFNRSMLSGLGVGFDVTVGGNVVPNLALGVMIGGATAPGPALDVGSDISDLGDIAEDSGWDVDGTSLVLNGVNANIFRVGVFLDYYFTATTNWHGLLALGYSTVTFTGDAVSDSPRGFAANAGVGYDFWLSYHWSLGLIGRVQWSPLSSREGGGVVHLISPHFGLSAAFH